MRRFARGRGGPAWPRGARARPWSSGPDARRRVVPAWCMHAVRTSQRRSWLGSSAGPGHARLHVDAVRASARGSGEPSHRTDRYALRQCTPHHTSVRPPPDSSLRVVQIGRLGFVVCFACLVVDLGPNQKLFRCARVCREIDPPSARTASAS